MVNDKGRCRQEHLMMQTFVQRLGPTALYLPDLSKKMAPRKTLAKTHPGLLKQTSIIIHYRPELPIPGPSDAFQDTPASCNDPYSSFASVGH